MAAHVVPGPLTRLLRARLMLLSVLILAVFAAGAGHMRETATLQLQGSVDANWRGAFDLLVRPAGGRLNVEATRGLVEPNYLTFSGAGGITLDQLARLREVAGVELAAPVAMIGNVRYVVGGPVVSIADLPAEPTLYQVTVRAETSDGVSNVLVQEENARLLLGPADLSGDSVPFATDAGSMSWSEDGLYVFFESLPPIASPVIAVDPVAERALLGPTADFLAPLESIAELPTAPVARNFDVNRIPESFSDQRFFVTALASDPNSAANQRPVIPVAASSTLYAPLTVTVEVRQVGQPLRDYPAAMTEDERLAEAAANAGDEFSAASAATIDAGASLRPLQPPRLEIVWPQSAAPSGSAASVGVAVDLNAELAGRPEYATIDPRPGSGRPSFVVTPQGWVDSAGRERAPGEAVVGSVRVGTEPAYRPSSPAPLTLLDTFAATGPLDRPFVFAPIAEFDLDALELPDNPLNYVPLGAYAVPETALVADGAGEALAERRAITPTLNPRGLVNMPPLAITDLRSAVALRGDAPIDAVRVRVSGISNFDDSAVARVEQVASAIAALGLDVDVVAGSSPQPVEVVVQPIDGAQMQGTSGWVEQGWTTLGAAERVVVGFTSTNTVLLALSGLTAVILASGMLLMQRAVRTTELNVLLALGWSRWRIVRWMVDEAAWAAALILGIGLAAWWLAGRSSPVGLTASMALAAVLPIVAAAGAWASLRGANSITSLRSGDVRAGSAGLVPTVAKPLTYGLRAAVARPVRTLVIALALGLAAAASAAGVVVVGSTAATVGPTRLAVALAQQLGPAQVGMLMAAIAGSAVIGIALLRMDLASRGSEMRVLTACGWDRRATRGMLTAHRMAIAIPAAAAAATIGSFLSLGLLGQYNGWVVALAAVAIVGVLWVEARWSAWSTAA